jgi:ribosomal-protein-alanine N-acetyltransferase
MITIQTIGADNFGIYQDAILEIERSSFPTPWNRVMFSSEVDAPFSYLWTLVREGTCIGYICFWLVAGEIHLLNLAIHRQERRKGWGRYLINAMIKAGRAKGAELAWLEVRPSNVAAQSLYQKTGFKETGRRPRYYRDTKEDAIVMSRSLAQETGTSKTAEDPAGLAMSEDRAVV